MSILMTFRIALKALNRNKMRTALTMLGMIIGVGAVITMVALGNGAQVSIEQAVQSAGTNVIMISAGNFSTGGVRGGQGAATSLTPDDAQAIREVPGVQYLVGDDQQPRRPDRRRQPELEHPRRGHERRAAADQELADGVGPFFTTVDVTSASKVCVIGTTVQDMLFPDGNDPVDQVIRIGKHPFKIIGVLASKGQSSIGQDQDDVIYAPFTTVQKKMRGVTYIENMTVSAASADNIKQTADAISAVLRVRHKIQPGDNDDFMVRTLEDIAAMRTETTKTMTALLAGIAGVSLLVGGIGIMNIMLVSVTERTREIGLRLAIGARGGDVLLQFLVEAVVLSLLGGSIGIGLGYGLSQGLTQFLQWPTYVSPHAVLISFGFAAGIGIFFGFYPARKASGLDPIEALRYE